MNNVSVKEKIKNRMDTLEELMKSNKHLSNTEEVEDLISSVSKFWSVLSDEDRDFIHGARYAIETKSKWC